MIIKLLKWIRIYIIGLCGHDWTRIQRVRYFEEGDRFPHHEKVVDRCKKCNKALITMTKLY